MIEYLNEVTMPDHLKAALGSTSGTVTYEELVSLIDAVGSFPERGELQPFPVIFQSTDPECHPTCKVGVDKDGYVVFFLDDRKVFSLVEEVWSDFDFEELIEFFFMIESEDGCYRLLEGTYSGQYI